MPEAGSASCPRDKFAPRGVLAPRGEFETPLFAPTFFEDWSLFIPEQKNPAQPTLKVWYCIILPFGAFYGRL
jgi:hypothetical protein